MESIDDLSCPVCLQISRNAVESNCCGHAFCEECANLIKGKQNQCPYCKQSPFQFREAKLIRRMISGIKVNCPNQKCEVKIANSDLEKHLLFCLFAVSKCRVCNENFIRQQLIKHTIQKHQDEANKAIIDFHNSTVIKSKISQASTNSINSSSKIGSSNILSISVIDDPIFEVNNKVGRKAILGQSGKYYCQGPLLFKCKCCDGSCGPSNGQNCVACMELDVKRRSLSKQYLVNSSGIIAKVDYQKGTVYCGIPFSSTFSLGKKKCSVGNHCHYCNILMKTLKRYQSLLL